MIVNVLNEAISESGTFSFNRDIRLKLAKGEKITVGLSAQDFVGLELGWNIEDVEEIRDGNSNVVVDATTFAEFSGYKIK